MAFVNPALFNQLYATVGSLVGIKVAPMVFNNFLGGAFIAVIINLAVTHIHAGVASPKASGGLVCAESTYALVLVALGYLRKDPSFYVLAIAPAFFFLWAYMELSTKKVAPSETTANTRGRKTRSQ